MYDKEPVLAWDHPTIDGVRALVVYSTLCPSFVWFSTASYNTLITWNILATSIYTSLCVKLIT